MLLTRVFALETSSMATDLVSRAEGRINGVFSQAVSIYYPPFSLSLLHKRSGSPFSVLLSENDLELVRKAVRQDAPVVMGKDGLIIGNEIVIDFSGAAIRSDYAERKKIVLSGREINERLCLTRRFLDENAAHNSLAAAYLGKEDSHLSWQENFAGGIYRNLFSRLRQALHPLDKSEFISVISKFMGCGIGLTPSGDDFLNGFLSTLQLAEVGSDPFECSSTGWLTDGLRLSLSSEKTNTWGWSILFPTLNGSLTDIVADAVEGICRMNKTDSAFELSKIGSSSGFDHIVGISFALETISTLTDEGARE